jgi:fatty acid desaturase
MKAPQRRGANTPFIWLFRPFCWRCWSLSASASSGSPSSTGVFLCGEGALFAWFWRSGLFTPMHEGAHGNLHGRRMRLRWLNDIVGRAMSVVLMATYSGFKILHLRHHANTNDEADDPDYWVAVVGPAHITWRCMTTFFRYYQIALFPPPGSSRRRRLLRRSSLLAIVSYVTLSGAVVLSGYGMELLGLWILPGLAAISLLSFAFNWLPHAPHTHRDPYRNARIMLGRGLTPLLVGQNYHAIHHLMPRIPFYRYGDVFLEMRQELENAGTEILGTHAKRTH